MARVNAFVEAGNENRSVSVGGRRTANQVYAWLNTVHRLGESAVRVSAKVLGRGLSSKDRRSKEIGDDRRVVFTITLPEPSEAVEIRIESANEQANLLVAMGAVLGGMKAAEHAAAGDVEMAQTVLDNFADILKEHENGLGDLPNVILPGGVTLREALAAVAVVNQLKQGGSIN